MNLANPVTKQLLTLVALMALLLLTFFLAHLDFGFLNVAISVAIALIKALLIGLFFMNLWQSDGINRIFAMAGAFMLFILLTLTLSDFLTRSWLEMPGYFPSTQLIAQ
ncbi:MAG TPA: cytochrome C oxidase subunit IV family protein [Myxococcota bacterium]|nr:cytochrome C oxidase subunit IV family protein [Myxococcota bacterium]